MSSFTSNNGTPQTTGTDDLLAEEAQRRAGIQGILESAAQNNANSTAGTVRDIESESYVSRGLNVINIPEVRDVSTTFLYNYYTQDEKDIPGVDSPDNIKSRVLDLTTVSQNNALFLSQTENVPRTVRIQFTCAENVNGVSYGDFESIDFSTFVGSTSDINDRINNIVRQMTLEGANASIYHIGVELTDIDREAYTYQLIANALNFHEIDTSNLSMSEAADAFFNSSGFGASLRGEDLRMVYEALSKTAPLGITYSSADVNEQDARTSKDPVSRQDVSMQVNKLFVSEAINGGTKYSDGVFQNEILAIQSATENIKSTILSHISDVNGITDDEFELFVQEIDSRPFNPQTDSVEDFPTIKVVGYLVEKYEIFNTLDVRFRGYLLYNGGSASRDILDNEVRYGGFYVYKVRTICEVVCVTELIDQSNTGNNSLRVSTVLMGSQGVNQFVECVERVPPPPPVCVRASFDRRKQAPFISWAFPLNPQRDIKRFQVFKRDSYVDEFGQRLFPTQSPFTLVAEYDFDNSTHRTEVNEIAHPETYFRVPGPRLSYTDTKFKIGDNPIYAIASVDAHGMTSNLSMQIQVDYDKFKNKLNVKVVSKKPAPKPYPNLFIEQDTFQDVISTSGFSRMKIFFDPDYYKVFKKDLDNWSGSPGTEPDLIDQEHIRASSDEKTYTFNIINVDLAKAQNLNVKIATEIGPPQNVSAIEFSSRNLFDFNLTQ